MKNELRNMLSEQNLKELQKLQGAKQYWSLDQIKESPTLCAHIDDTDHDDIRIRTIRKFDTSDMVHLSHYKDLNEAQQWIYGLTELADKVRHTISDDRYKLKLFLKLGELSESYPHPYESCKMLPRGIQIQKQIHLPDKEWYMWFCENIRNTFEDKLADMLFYLIDYSGMKGVSFNPDEHGDILAFSTIDEALFIIAQDITDNSQSEATMIHTAIIDYLAIRPNLNIFTFLAMRIRYYMLASHKLNKIKFW